ncbi:amidohydrolase [Pacificimonas flava]|uniref:Amidohydrolase n=2 Tax=Pacificimonas TaxID=1960290 RepID=A0A219B3K6_9SPHN|nr:MULTISPECIES: amidohydrolase family protein [Pacificimonas]MBZ6377585.1 amidohydrolase family protein [Pacificimonas aurantium]OWV32723.1 amidohydrolase [Pacificimonas flava]
MLTLLRPALVLLSCALLVSPALAQPERLTIIANGEQVGHVEADRSGREVRVHYDLKNNGRGPTTDEVLILDEAGLPQRWTIKGSATFGGEIEERFVREGGEARWSDSTGQREAALDAPTLYVAQNASPWALGLYARVLLDRPDRRIAALPGGTLSLEPMAPVTLGSESYRAFWVRGIGLSPDMVLLDGHDRLFAVLSARGVTVRSDAEAYAAQLQNIAAERTAERFEAIQAEVARDFDAPIRIRDVRIFDAESGTLGEPVSVLVFRDRIAAVEPLTSPPTPGEVLIDGGGGTLVPGLHDMHAHVGLQSALLYLAAGVTSVRDMGNDNGFLLDLQARIESGDLAGPRIIRNGFLEGRSDYSSRNGFIVDSESAALDAVRWYAARGYWQIKIYNSLNPDWVPAVVREARRLGMGVTGHIPAFTDADAMISAGYDEITHINQLMLGWVLDEGEDTRTPLRLTAMRRTADLDLSAERVERTVAAMASEGVALDPTAVTLELLMLSRDGAISPAVANYFDHLPVGLQRRRQQAIAPIESGRDDAAYRGSFERIKELVKRLHDRGVQLLPGTDDGTGLSVHRELQIYAEAGIPPAEVLSLATLGAETYLGREQMLGSIEKGKLADFLLIDGNPLEDLALLHDIRMVVKDGTVYFPADIWTAVGVEPFAGPPEITMPASP